MRTINDVDTVGIYQDEIRIVPKHGEPENFDRNIYQLSIIDAEKIEDEKVAGGERRLAITMKNSVHCDVYMKEIRCGGVVGKTH